MKKVFVAMSGGVDSSVTAALLKKQGFDIVGIYIKPWQSNNLFFDCLWQEDREDAALVAAKLNIPFLTWDFSREYEKDVVRYMINGYQSGITPNPDVMCNKYIKFGLFLDKALKQGAEYIATGHYARTKNRELLKSKDLTKDQTYFLWTLTQKQLKHCLFPIGDYHKSDVRKLARKFGLPNWDKKDSQGVCFIGPLNIKDFLKNHIKEKRGKIILDDLMVGEHDGIFYYTIGEKITVNSSPYFVIGKDLKKNILYVSDKRENRPRKEFRFTSFNLIGNGIHFPLNCQVKTRYQQKEIKAVLKKGKAELEEFLFDISPGQSAVFYRGNRVIGGGIIQ